MPWTGEVCVDDPLDDAGHATLEDGVKKFHHKDEAGTEKDQCKDEEDGPYTPL